jgi:hypothetical protein
MSPYLRTLRFFSAAIALIAGLVVSINQAAAHVVYGNSLFSDPSVIDPITGLNGVGSAFSSQDRTVRSNAGWIAGLNAATGGDSHNARFLYFNLAGAATIDFTVTALANSNGASLLNPGYSIFSGAVPNVSHDGAPYAGQTPFATWSPFANSAVGSDPSSQKWGEFRANANVTMAHSNGTTGTMTYTGLFGATGTGNTITGTYTLGPGLYTLVIGGANSTDLAALLSHAIATNGDYTTPSGALTGYTNARLARNFNIQFNVSPIPIPAAAWLFGSGVVGLVALARRRSLV